MIFKFLTLIFVFQTVPNVNSFKSSSLKKPKRSRISSRQSLSMSQDYQPSSLVENLGAPLGERWSYGDFLSNLKHNNIESVTILSNNEGFVAIDKLHSATGIQAENLHPIQSSSQLTSNLIDVLVRNGINFDILDSSRQGVQNLIVPLVQVGFYYLAIGTLTGVLYQAMMKGGHGKSNIFGFLGGDTDFIDQDQIQTKFDDVAGIDTIKGELLEIVDYLKNPKKYEDAGAKVPKGFLLEGQPGVGKTLLARAVAGESGVPFISVSGSSFVEMFVGVGAKRIRDLFNKAKGEEKCIIFIDEIDAVGRQRSSSSLGGGNDEREQTLNQLLTELDGFNDRSGVIILAATNRIDLLDNALTRPGRFDRKITVPLPDTEARKKIIEVHSRGKKFSERISAEEVASLTSGFSGADIQNLLNEACILSVREGSQHIKMDHILQAFEKIQIGIPVDSSSADPNVKELVAYHEAAHVLCSLYFANSFNFRQATIRANSNGAGGYTLFTPLEKYIQFPNKKYMLARLVVVMAGRAGESLLYSTKELENDDYLFQDNDFDELYVTAGASSDLQVANSLATNYLTRWGFSNDFLYYTSADEGFDSRTSEETKGNIDSLKRDLINHCYLLAKKIISQNPEYMEYIAKFLIDNETITLEDLPELEINY